MNKTGGQESGSSAATEPELRDRVLVGLGRVAARALIGFIRGTSKVEVIGLENVRKGMDSGRPVIFPVWHGSVLSMAVLRTSVQLPRLFTIVSRSRDGEIASSILRTFETVSYRGSSSRGGAAGLLQIVNQFGAGSGGGGPMAGVQVIDGPRGPRHESKPGILLLAKRSNALIVPVVSGLARRRVLRSWDRHRVPLPFGRCVFLFGEPIDLGSETSEESEFTTENLDRAMRALAASHPLAARDEAVA